MLWYHQKMTQQQDHARQAQDCLLQAGGDLSSGLLIAKAQVHATLALADAIRDQGEAGPLNYYVNVPAGLDAEAVAKEVSRRIAAGS